MRKKALTNKMRSALVPNDETDVTPAMMISQQPTTLNS